MLVVHPQHEKSNTTLINKLILLVYCFTNSFFAVANNVDASSSIETESVKTLTLATSENADYFSPKESLIVMFPSAFEQHKMQNITVELDAVDITEMVQHQNSTMAYTPLQAMLVGSHELRIAEYTDDGDINELGVWYFNVRMSELFEEYSLAADTQINSSYLLDEKNDYATSNDFQNNANSQVGFKIKKGNWYAEGQFDLHYTSVKENRPSDRTIENSDFIVSLGNQFIEAKIGHQNVNQSSMIMDNFRRRGVSVKGKIPNANIALTGFSLSNIDVTGFGHGLGISDPQQRVNGYSVSTTPFSDSPKLLNLSATWISGKGNEGNNFVADFDDYQDPYATEPVSETGNAWTIVTDSFLLDEKLRLRAEYAETEFNFNPLDNLSAEKDSAENLLVTYAENTDSGIGWNVGANYQRIGTYFKSLANRGLPSDKQLSKLFAGIQWETVNLQVSGEEQKDNLESIAQLPETTTQLNSINVNWSPQLTAYQKLLGTPNFSFAYNEQNQLQNNLPLDYFFPAADNQMENWQASGSFNYDMNSWGLTLMNTNFTDNSGVQNDSDTNSINVFANIMFNDTSSISPSIQFDQSTDKITGLSSIGVTYTLQSMFTLIPYKLDGSADLILNKNASNDLLTKGENVAINVALNWNIRESKANQIGVKLALGGTYNNFEDKVFTSYSQETYQIYLNATFILPGQLGTSD